MHRDASTLLGAIVEELEDGAWYRILEPFDRMKVVTVHQIIDYLKEKDIPGDQIIYINKELFEFDEIKNYKHLHQYVSDLSTAAGKRYYLFIDEIQEIDQWGKTVNSLLAEGNYDLLITGSNASFLSTELATILAGRCVEFREIGFDTTRNDIRWMNIEDFLLEK